MKWNQKGFTGFEIVLVLVALIATGAAGYYAYQVRHTQPADNSVNVPHKKVTQSSAPQPSTPAQYFSIKEWGVKAPYSGADTLTYKLNGNVATVASKQLSAKYSGCSEYGAGQIRRLQPSDGAYPDGSGPTVEQYASQNPGLYTKVGSYYYQFKHDDSVCADDGSGELQNQANSTVQGLVSKFVSN